MKRARAGAQALYCPLCRDVSMRILGGLTPLTTSLKRKGHHGRGLQLGLGPFM